MDSTAADSMAHQSYCENLFGKAAATVHATFTYDELVLQISPLALVLALSPFFLRHYSQAPVYLRHLPFPRLKLFAAGSLICLEFSNVLLRRMRLDPQADAMVAAALIDLVAALTIGIILYIEQGHGIRASSLLPLYVFLGCIMDAAKCHLFYLDQGLSSASAIAAAAGFFRLIVLFLEIFPRKLLVVNENAALVAADETLREEKRRRAWFVFPTLTISRQLRITIENGNLMPIAPEFASDRLYHKLKSYWQLSDEVKEKMEKTRRTAQIDGKEAPHLECESLMATCYTVWETELRRILVPRFFFAVCTFSQPFILKAVIDVVGQEQVSLTRKACLIAATVGVFVGMAIAKSSYTHMNYLMVTRLRGSLITQIIEKTHRISYKDARESATVSLMSTSIDGIAAALPRAVEFPIICCETCFGIYTLSFFIGNSSFLVAVPVLVSNIISWFWGFATEPALSACNKSAETRVSMTTSVIYQLGAIKMMGLGPTIVHLLQRLRQEEVKLSKTYRNLETVTFPLAQIASLMTPVWIVSKALSREEYAGGVPANVIFPILALVAAIQGPLGRLLDMHSTISSLSSRFEGIQKFLCLPERDEYRYIKNKHAPKHRRIPPRHQQFVQPVEMVDVDIAPPGVRQPVLFRVDFSLVQGSITAIVGSPGTGKSTLLHGMLGEASLVEGAICVQNEDMAICGQVTWLQDVSILDNIIGPLPYNANFFRRVVGCCLLENDLAHLPGGADYIVGLGGRNLSTGQRQRIGIARTVYARTAVMLFDDPFGSLDRKTAVSIIFHLFGASGLLREMGITVALVSYLRESLDVSDRVLLLDGRGYASLEDQPFQTPSFAASVKNVLDSAPESPSEEVEYAEREAIRRSLEFERQSSCVFGGGAVATQPIPTPLSTLYIKPIGYLPVALYALLVFCLSLGEQFPNIYLRDWFNSGSKDNGFFICYASVAGGTCLVGTLSYWLLYVKLAPRASLELHKKLVNTIAGSTLAYLGVVNMGSVLTLFDQDAVVFSRQLPFYSMRTAYAVFSIIIKTSIIISGASYFVAILPLLVLALYRLQRFYSKTSRQLRNLDVEAKAPLFKRFEETADGIMYMRAFRWLKADTEISFGLLNVSQRAFYYLYYFQQWLVVVIGLLTSSIAVCFVSYVVFFPNATTEAAIGLSLLTLSQFGWTLERLFEVATLLETSTGALERLSTFLQRTPQEPEREVTVAPPLWPSAGNIEIVDVTATYEPNSDTPPALRHLSLFIEPGQRVGLTGSSGSGKTSVLNAILGFVEYTGTIKIDGVDLATLSRDEIRSRLVTISEEQVHLDASIRVNLLPFTMNQAASTDPVQRQIEQDEAAQRDGALEDMLRRFGLWPPLQRKEGLDTLLDDAGYAPAEMQLVCIARAILRQRATRSKVVLVDEVTSGVDFWRQGFVQDIMRESFPGCTMLVAARREESILDVSVVLEMAHGVIMHAARRDL
ncbi:Vacuolar multidrug resistance efflux pump [Cordyceps militaris CM01]|uniref:Vacuolar multidrug resistance efflux pump n=1 Tax=Cordyceps militaris (strain CM01) TaxID=983644 RepID=G3J318_CORMM|nr:Vacuolar multidrug resistance efflux pump [Cordyceps militaris CM01]EGX95601.1 Vacuolar multidrug resistance efflux pump [Cordyceps militaris CM01]